ncbi:GrpB family protein [Guptibacillus hwajinpoensis]|uniref:GrpB-like predicted nucleotidyltransferase (UPF0157 family) n=1 Tax=Guptibacillus hwajinpoensis TaxID=208199 RepID=A0ABU0K3K0_9BACL|nr:GrpB family protein [Alkalihalobacillus hemicentroti]MDQ0483928.1 GrpB-like predicted nucleotidyltransferase (UPF0157 family) [Alkalihalobacillus hemicentroti]
MTKPTVQLNEYNDEWESQFEYEKERMIAALGDKIAGIEHIGSTSIKGLKAKPIIDILIGVEDLRVTADLVQPLNEIEFEYVPKQEFTDSRFFRKGLWGQGTCHLHICEIDRTEWIEKIVFRDYLRKHSNVAEEYALLKSELATIYKDDRSTYTKQKEPFIKDTIRKARREFQT